MTTLKSILEELCKLDKYDRSVGERELLKINNAISAIKKLMLEKVGEDEVFVDFETTYIRDSKRTRNTFKAEIRKAVIETL